MSIDIVVIRGDGSRFGGIIEDPLITTVPVALSRGQAECDEASPHIPYNITCIYINDVKPGELCEILDSLQGKAWRGKIIGVSHLFNLARLQTTLRIRRVYEPT